MICRDILSKKVELLIDENDVEGTSLFLLNMLPLVVTVINKSVAQWCVTLYSLSLLQLGLIMSFSEFSDIKTITSIPSIDLVYFARAQ